MSKRGMPSSISTTFGRSVSRGGAQQMGEVLGNRVVRGYPIGRAAKQIVKDGSGRVSLHRADNRLSMEPRLSPLYIHFAQLTMGIG